MQNFLLQLLMVLVRIVSSYGNFNFVNLSRIKQLMCLLDMGRKKAISNKPICAQSASTRLFTNSFAKLKSFCSYRLVEFGRVLYFYYQYELHLLCNGLYVEDFAEIVE